MSTFSYQEIKSIFTHIGYLINDGCRNAAIVEYENVMRNGATLHDRDELLGKDRVAKLIRFARSMGR